jgi:acylglycerol lipase
VAIVIALLVSSAFAAGSASLQSTINSGSGQDEVQPIYEIATSPDGTTLSCIRWQATPSHPSRTTALVLHGIGFHSEPYQVLANGLNHQGIDVYAVDARGHGRSAGVRGRVPTAAQVRDDINAVVAIIRRRAPDTRLFLIGESMGSAFVFAYLTGPSSEVAGAVMLEPPLKIRISQLFKGSTLLKAVYGLLRPDAAAISLVDSRLEESSRSKEFVAQRRSDPLAYQKVSIRYLLGIFHLTKNWKTTARNINIPLLVMQGSEDPIVDLSATQRFVTLVASPEKKLVVVEGALHTLLWDPETPNVIKAINSWLTHR